MGQWDEIMKKRYEDPKIKALLKEMENWSLRSERVISEIVRES